LNQPLLITDQLLRQFTSLWWEGDPLQLPPLPQYTSDDQSAREAHLEDFLSTLTEELDELPRTETELEGLLGRIMPAVILLGNTAFGLDQDQVNLIYQSGFDQVAVQFAQAARRFDRHISGADIFQAGRNAMTMVALQILLQQPVELTPAMLGYSLLYPYSDNYLDDARIPPAIKKTFMQRFARRLRGDSPSPENNHERVIFDLIGLIEDQYDRSEYDRVFQSLLAIHQGQLRSVALLHQDASPYEIDVLGISFEKGGASVLADGYLVAGTLSPAQQAFAFGYGIFLQLVDDLQDVHTDRKAGPMTVFSQTARHWTLDGVTNRAFQFGHRVLDLMDTMELGELESLRKLLQIATNSLLIDAASSAGRFYSKGYLRGLEVHSPFRFSFLTKQRKRLARKGISLTRLVEAFASPVSSTPPG
jgi:hypothetical protein